MSNMKALNDAIFDGLAGSALPTDPCEAVATALAEFGEPDPWKLAVDAVNMFTRARLCEESFMRKIFQVEDLGPADQDTTSHI